MGLVHGGAEGVAKVGHGAFHALAHSALHTLLPTVEGGRVLTGGSGEAEVHQLEQIFNIRPLAATGEGFGESPHIGLVRSCTTL